MQESHEQLQNSSTTTDQSNDHVTLLIDFGLRRFKSTVVDSRDPTVPIYTASYRLEKSNNGMSLSLSRSPGDNKIEHTTDPKRSPGIIVSTGVVLDSGSVLRYTYQNHENTLKLNKRADPKSSGKSYGWVPTSLSINGKPQSFTWNSKIGSGHSVFECVDEEGRTVAKVTTNSSMAKGKIGQFDLYCPLVQSVVFRDEILTTCILVAYPEVLAGGSMDKFIGSVVGWFKADEDVFLYHLVGRY